MILEPQETDTRMCTSLGVWKEMVNRQSFKTVEFSKPGALALLVNS